MKPTTPARARRGRTRMSSAERREQLIVIARPLFADKGFDGTSVEEIALHADVSKPVIYEHFGGKEGLYAVVVDREVQRLDEAIRSALGTSNANYRELIERATLALLDYIDRSPDGFRIISRDSSVMSTSGAFASILSDVTAQVQELLVPALIRHGFDAPLAGLLSQALVGMVAMAGQSWLEERQPPKEVVAAFMVNLAWNGLSNLEANPALFTQADPITGRRIRRPETNHPTEQKAEEQVS